MSCLRVPASLRRRPRCLCAQVSQDAASALEHAAKLEVYSRPSASARVADGGEDGCALVLEPAYVTPGAHCPSPSRSSATPRSFARSATRRGRSKASQNCARHRSCEIPWPQRRRAPGLGAMGALPPRAHTACTAGRDEHHAVELLPRLARAARPVHRQPAAERRRDAARRKDGALMPGRADAVAG